MYKKAAWKGFCAVCFCCYAYEKMIQWIIFELEIGAHTLSCQSWSPELRSSICFAEEWCIGTQTGQRAIQARLPLDWTSVSHPCCIMKQNRRTSKLLRKIFQKSVWHPCRTVLYWLCRMFRLEIADDFNDVHLA